MSVDWILLDELDRPRSADGQMAADVAMLEAVLAGGPPMLRLYRWQPAALSIGRYQLLEDVDLERCAAHGIAVTRRPTGGRALLHGGDLTYAVAMRVPDGIDGVLASYAHIAGGLIAGLAQLGVQADVAHRAGDRGVACFASHEGADLAIDGRKLCGSAQVQRGGALLQHGAVLLARTPVNETDLLHYNDEGQRAREAHRLNAATVTMEELGASTDPRAVADAVIQGFAVALTAAFRPGRLDDALDLTAVSSEGHRSTVASA